MLKRYDVNQAMPFTLLMPLFGVLFAAIFLSEPVGWGLLIGGLLTLAGVAITIGSQRRSVAKAEAEIEGA